MPNKLPDTAMTNEEAEIIRRVAKCYGISEEEAQTCLAKAGLARRVRKRTGKAQARIYSIRGKR